MTSGSSLRIGAVIVAAGSGVRFGEAAKVFAPLGGQPILAWSLERFARHPRIHSLVVVLGEHTIEDGRRLLRDLNLNDVRLCRGGATRSDSVRAGLAALPDTDIVLVHDGARPLVSDALIDSVIDATLATGAAVPVLPVGDTVHLATDDGLSAGVVDRSVLRVAQTPQGARRTALLEAFRSNTAATDEGGLLQAAGFPVALVEGDRFNIKITWPGDIALAEALLASRGVRA